VQKSQRNTVTKAAPDGILITDKSADVVACY